MRWQIHHPLNVSPTLRNFVGGHPLVAERLTRGGLTEPATARAFLDPAHYRAASPFELPDVTVAVERLRRAIRLGELILIWGDFDVDGQTATALLFTALQRLGANVRYHVPLRAGEGHGMHLPKLREWLAQNVRVIVTCDTGITAHAAVEVAQAAGVDVLITDHHLLGETLPKATAVINPMRLPPEHALRELPGVGVAYELIRALTDGENCDDFLDLVALGIVADVARQVKETRYLLQRGLALARLSARPGLRALLGTAGINQLELDERDLGFTLGPRLNAQGRLGDASASVELLATNDAARAAELANQLEGMNARRKLESRFVEESAEGLLEREPSLLDYAALVLAHPEWSGGVVGIVANRLADKYHKPVVLLGEQDDLAFGSARSVPGCNITEALHACGAKLVKFGGHAMAAGLTLRREDVFEFRRLLSRTVRASLSDTSEEPTLEIDGSLKLAEVTPALWQDLQRLAPFGNGNAPLVLASMDLRIARKKKLGRQGDHLDLIVEDAHGAQQRALWWNTDAQQLPQGCFDLAYSLTLSRYQGRSELVMEVVDLQAHESAPVLIETTAPSYVVEDCRATLTPREALAEFLQREPAALVWREADAALDGANRTELQPATTLVVWTTPPGPEEWEAALTVVNPQRIVIFGQQPAPLTVEMFLQRLGGLLKHTLTAKDGQTTLAALAAATAQRTDAIRQGLHWFNQTGQLRCTVRTNGQVQLERAATTPSPIERAALEKLLQYILEETAAYRKNWRVEVAPQ